MEKFAFSHQIFSNITTHHFKLKKFEFAQNRASLRRFQVIVIPTEASRCIIFAFAPANASACAVEESQLSEARA